MDANKIDHELSLYENLKNNKPILSSDVRKLTKFTKGI